MTAENERDAAAVGDGATPEEDGRATGDEPAPDAPGSSRGEAGSGPDGEAVAGGARANGSDSAGEHGDESGAAGDDAASPEARAAAAEAEAAAHWDRLVRLQAEMENQRKRAQRDVANARKFALEGIAQDLLPVKDSLELGIRAASDEEANVASLREGSELTLKMLAQVLEKHGIVEIDPEGEKFDPEFHQAMSMQEVEGVAPNTVTGVMQKGYLLNERLIRPALVMVSK